VDDLEEAARSALAMNDLPAALAGTAADTVRGILRSPIWKRAEAAETRLAEVPFQVVLEEGTRPVLVRGVVDLAFVENGKWVLVDYKTDRAGGRIPRNLLRKYVSQLETYRRAWRKCTGGEVGELYLYFIVPDLLLRVG
jgi:ATP-dependent helicase/nuclease subunit A